MMKLPLILALLSVSGGSALKVTSVSGQDVNLTCKYDIKYHGALSMCWGRGDIPNSGCNNQLIASDGRLVTFGGGASSRYRFLGRLQDGDVSLTVLNVLETDAGRYGCRVQIKGWFNDEAHHIDLSVERAPKTTTSTPLNTTTEHTHTHTAADQMNSTQILQTNSSLSPEDGSSVFLLSVVFGALAPITLVAAIVVLASRRRRLSKNSELQFLGSAASEMQSRGSVVENVYQLEDNGEGVDGSEYEILPGAPPTNRSSAL
ncbi:T-cell immunoglobulin and mucin domain-containing protein 4-like [Gymnodraco acuticeps]|uniref:T-cell immunoglobulin and mucin domain-containing protein 4-like n=1 Tax=Gymnodraco acuticeps TaxID=8218 RepID=UPI00147224A1|nr:T-cell immunoglobulin and mucin domain-containing protein 4-like [Gymnodraco acuticeps]